jgi:predicted glycosyltransferase
MVQAVETAEHESGHEISLDEGAGSLQKRVLFFVFDGGTGLGHLRRLSCIAKHLQGDFACLLVTGHRAAANWFVPPECEYVHVPAWDSLLAEKAAYWGRRPFLEGSPDAVAAFRRQMLQGIVEAFQPDVIIVDHLPLGMREELSTIIEHTPCLKYLVTRAIQNETENLDRLLLTGPARQAIEKFYHRVFLAIDPNVFDLCLQYPQIADLSAKFLTVGYVLEPVTESHISACRNERGVSANEIWAVASAGGGQHGEQLVQASCNLAHYFPQVTFDVVIGPRSNLSYDKLRRPISSARNLRLHREYPNLAPMHAAADIVISSGGYNSLLEALQGRARIICVPSRKDERDEQFVHAVRLGSYASIDVSIDVSQLPLMFENAVQMIGRGDHRNLLNFDGANKIKKTIKDDLGIKENVRREV